MIHADQKRINTDKELLYADITYKVRGSLFEVFNELGSGHKELVYQTALAYEFEKRGITYAREANLPVEYKGKRVVTYRPDFVIEERVVLELKAVPFMIKTYEEQLVHYLKTIGFQLGLLVNFGGERLFIKRFVSTNQRKSVDNQ